MMNFPSEAEARIKLAPLHSSVIEAVMSAWSKYLELLARDPVSHKRTRANLVWDWTVTNLKSALAVQGIEARPCANHLSTWFYIEDNFIFRIKKGSPKGHTRSYPTQAALDFYDPQSSLDGIPDAVRLDIVYILDELNTSIRDVRAVCKVGAVVKWSYSILEAVTEEVPQSITSLPEKKKLVKTKPGLKKEELSGQDSGSMK